MSERKYDSPYGGMNDRNAGTYVPGMHTDASGVKNEQRDDSNDSPVVGFLYSISRKGIGEFWPLHLGSNKIGRAADCDICLKEMSVSEHHATINIRQMRSTHKVIASIRDEGSKNGIFLNDEELDFESHSCKANDIILIGHSYKLVLLLVDAEQYGLSVAENFVAAEEEMSQPNNFKRVDLGNTINPYNPKNRKVDNGTVNLNGTEFDAPGKTQELR